MKTTLILAITMLLSLNIFSQSQKPPMKDPEVNAKSTVSYLAENMTLTEKQQKSMTPIFTSYFKAAMEARQKQDPKGRETAQKTLENDLKKILNEKEAKEVQKLLEEQRAKMRQQPPKGGSERMK